ncbi:hypothetical protein RFI_37712, partial [Reticulomyxa filosa]
ISDIAILRESDIYKITNETLKMDSRNKIILTRKNVEQKNAERHYEMIEAISKPLELSDDFIDVHIAWKKAKIVHIHKPDRDHSRLHYYQVLANDGKDKLNDSQLLHQTQAGFQSWHNTYELSLR